MRTRKKSVTWNVLESLEAAIQEALRRNKVEFRKTRGSYYFNHFGEWGILTKLGVNPLDFADAASSSASVPEMLNSDQATSLSDDDASVCGTGPEDSDGDDEVIRGLPLTKGKKDNLNVHVSEANLHEIFMSPL